MCIRDSFETKITLEELCDSAARLLRPYGRFCMIHRVSRMAEIFRTLRAYRLEPKELRLDVYKRQEEDAP